MTNNELRPESASGTPAGPSADNYYNNQSPAEPTLARLRLRLAMLVGWGILIFLLTIGLVTQPVQAQEVPAGQLPSSITMTHSVKNGRKALAFKVNAPHSVFRYYDRIGTSWDNSGGKCRKNRVWFDYYMADVYDDTKPIRQSYEYTFRQREEGAKVCLRVAFGDFRHEGGVAGYTYGPFSFTASQPPVEKPTEKPDPTEATATNQELIKGRIDWDDQIELPAGSQLSIELRDANTTSSLIAKSTIAGPTPPHNLRLEYDPTKINQRRTYKVVAQIHGPDGKLWFHNDTGQNVIPGGNPENVQIDLVAGRQATRPVQEDQSKPPTESTSQPAKPTPIPDSMPETERPPEVVAKPDPPAVEPSAESPAPEPTPIDESPEPLEIATALDRQLAATSSTADLPPDETKTSANQPQRSSPVWLAGYFLIVIAAGLAALKLIDKKAGR